jgi:cytochrome c3-like protein
MLRLAQAVLTAAALLLAAGPGFAQDSAANTCIDCHGDLLKDAGTDVHRDAGVSCADCHGGDPTQADPDASMDKAKGFLGKPVAIGVAQLCARCHADIERMAKVNPRLPTDQFALYQTSVHGKLAAQGNVKVATCASCHGAHGIRHVNDPAAPVHPTHVVETCTGCHNPTYMKDIPIPSDQLEKYKLSVHGQKRLVERDLGAPACNTCHGNHGAAPPGLSAVTHVCGTCHATQAELFEASTHAAHFRDRNQPPCITCHSHHDILRTSDELLGTGEHGVCKACHKPGDRCDQATIKMKQGLTALEQAIDRADEALEQAARQGMDVEKPMYDLTAAREAVVRARVQVHSFTEKAFGDVIAQGMAVVGGVEKVAQGLLDEYTYRRKGLAVAAVVLLVFAGLLMVKAHQIEKRREETTKS